MSLLGSSGEECYVCGKDIDSDDCVEFDGHKFCCKECKKQYEDEEKPDDKEEICEFC